MNAKEKVSYKRHFKMFVVDPNINSGGLIIIVLTNFSCGENHNLPLK